MSLAKIIYIKFQKNRKYIGNYAYNICRRYGNKYNNHINSDKLI